MIQRHTIDRYNISPYMFTTIISPILSIIMVVCAASNVLLVTSLILLSL